MTEKEMKCPFCGEKMEPGAILGESTPLKWQSDEKKMFLGIWSTGHAFGTRTKMNRPKAVGFRCARCYKIIVDE